MTPTRPSAPRRAEGWSVGTRDDGHSRGQEDRDPRSGERDARRGESAPRALPEAGDSRRVIADVDAVVNCAGVPRPSADQPVSGRDTFSVNVTFPAGLVGRGRALVADVRAAASGASSGLFTFVRGCSVATTTPTHARPDHPVQRAGGRQKVGRAALRTDANRGEQSRTDRPVRANNREQRHENEPITMGPERR